MNEPVVLVDVADRVVCQKPRDSVRIAPGLIVDMSLCGSEEMKVSEGPDIRVLTHFHLAHPFKR